MEDPFSAISIESRRLLEHGFTHHRFAKGDTIVDKGDVVSGAYFVLAGRLRVYTLSPTGIEATLYLIDPGETCILALNSLFNNLRYPAWVAAEADGMVGIVNGPTYRQLFEREPSIRDLTVRGLSTVVFRLMTELEQVHSSRLDQRLASFLVAQASPDNLVRKTQQEIASHIGTTREVVARLIGRLSTRGLIETSRGCIRIVRIDQLVNAYLHPASVDKPDTRQTRSP